MTNLLRLCLALVCALCLWAQDAGLALRTSVGYNTMKASLPLSPEQRKEADRLLAEATRVAQSGNFGEAMRHMYHGMALMNGAEWTPALEAAAALQARVKPAIAPPDGKMTLTLTPLYKSDSKLLISVVLRKQGAGETNLLDKKPLESLSVELKLPGVAAGPYVLETRLAGEDGVTHTKARVGFLKATPVLIDTLDADAVRLRARLAKAKPSKALPTAEYALDLFSQSQDGSLNPHRVDFRKEFAAAGALVDALDSGADPFAGKKGDIRRAYLSAVDQQRQPYRLFVPSRYDGKQAMPLVVALHGMGGDENSIFDPFYQGAFQREAERHGFLVVCPKGRDSASMYRGTAERDVMDVIAEVERDYKIDANKIFLTGHSMGGYGSWSIAMNFPSRFAALGPFAGGGNPGGMTKLAGVPQYVVHGDNDKTVPVAQSRAMVEAGKKAGAKIVYKEIAGGNHTDIVAPEVAAMFDFFAQQCRCN